MRVSWYKGNKLTLSSGVTFVSLLAVSCCCVGLSLSISISISWLSLRCVGLSLSISCCCLGLSLSISCCCVSLSLSIICCCVSLSIICCCLGLSLSIICCCLGLSLSHSISISISWLSLRCVPLSSPGGSNWGEVFAHGLDHTPPPYPQAGTDAHTPVEQQPDGCGGILHHPFLLIDHPQRHQGANGIAARARERQTRQS